MHAACWKWPGEKGSDHVEGSFTPETFRLVGTRKWSDAGLQRL